MNKQWLLLLACVVLSTVDAVAADVITNVTGLVTFFRNEDRYVFLRLDDGTAARLWLNPGVKTKIGDVIKATGKRRIIGPILYVDDVDVEKLGQARVQPPVDVMVRDLYTVPQVYTMAGADWKDGDPAPLWFGVPVRLTVRVADVNRRRTQLQLFVCDLDDETMGATVSIPFKENQVIDTDLRRGAVVEIKGAGAMAFTRENGVYTAVKDLGINLESLDDLTILTRAPWWTPAKIATAAWGGGFALALLAVWILFLNRAIHAEKKAKEAAKASEDERRRLAHDLHDEFQQLLAGAMFRLDAAASVVEDPGEAVRQIVGAKKSLAFSQAALRNILWNLQAAGSEADTLAGFFRYAASRMPHWEGVVEISEKGTPPPELRRHGGRLLMILQEAVGNALRHGGAEHIRVRLASDGTALKMTIRDDGCGFTPGDGEGARGNYGGFGIPGMRRRAEEMDAKFSIESSPGKGTTVTVVLRPYATGNQTLN